MRRYGKIKMCLLGALVCTVAFAAAACTDEDHTHDYSQEWAFDAEAHWHPATCGHDAKTGKSAHAFTETVIPAGENAGYTLHICACGYSYTSDPTAPNAPETWEEFRYNEEGHWKPSLNGEGAAEVLPHECDEVTVVQPTCSSAGYTKHACACGYWYADTPVAPLAHTFDEKVVEYSESAHWHPCLVCGLPAGREAHDYAETLVHDCDEGGYTQFTCKDCGYSFRGNETPAGHTFEETLTGGEYTHWRASACGHEVKADEEEHVFFGRSRVCAVCGKEVSPRLAFRLSADGEYYTVTGIGSIEGSEITIPDTWGADSLPVREIAARAFAGEEVTSVTFGSNLVKIGASAFAGTQIAAAELTAGVEEIGAKAFAETGLVSVTLRGSLKKVGQGAFSGCVSLQNADIGGLTAIPDFAFEGCAVLQSVTGTPTEVGAQAFYGCAQLATLDLSACEKVGFSAFADCAQFAPADLAALASAEQYAFTGTGVQTANLPALQGAIAENMFENCASLTGVTLAAAEIGAAAFRGCATLSSVALTGTKIIGESAFENCAALDEISLADVLRVGVNAFRGSGAIEDKSGVQYVDKVLVGADAETQNVSVEAGTVGIADEAFRHSGAEGNTALQSVTLVESVRFIGANAFRKCTALTEVELSNVATIGANAFRESGLVSVTVPATVDTVGDNAFYDCMSLTTVSVSARAIGKFAFSYTGEGRTLNSPVKVRPKDAKLANVTIGEGVKSIGSNAFQYAPMTAVTLPQSLEEIGGYAFAQTDLAAVSIPAKVVRIGGYAFYESQLATATFAAATGWTAGGKAVTLGTDAQNATSLKAADIDWVRG